MKILVGCECTGTVRDEFRRRGHDAWSCDLINASGSHLHGDVRFYLRNPPGTLTGDARWRARWDALKFVRDDLAASGIPKICIENPIGALSSLWRKPDQIIQPYQFGDDASKATCFWLIGLKKLVIDPAKRFPGRWVTDPRTGKRVERWGNQTDSGQNRLPPSNDRWLKRAKTYAGIAAAMAEQWG